MGQAVLNGVAFPIDPMSVSWNFQIKTARTRTVGGWVVQAFGANLTDMVVQSRFRDSDEQARWFRWLHGVAHDQSNGGEPVRFLYPPKRWDFQVYVQQLTQAGSSSSIRWANDAIAPQYTLMLQISRDNGQVTEVAANAYLARLAKGFGWKQTKYNGPMTMQEVEQHLGGRDIATYIEEAWRGLAPGSLQAMQETGGGAVSLPTGAGALAGSQVAAVARGAGFSGENLVIAVAISYGEARWDPRAKGDTTIQTATWGPSIGLWQIRSLKAQTGTGKNRDATRLEDPNFNARAAFAIFQERGNFTAWSVYTSGAYRQYMDAARAAVEGRTSGGAQGSRSGTPPIQRIRAEVEGRWSVTNMGIHNRRKISGSNKWSQHSWGNAWDIGGSQGTLWAIYNFLDARRDQFSISTLCFHDRGPCNAAQHADHIHVDCHPLGTGTPPIL